MRRLLLAFLLLTGCRETAPPPRPAGVPERAVLAGGPDGGAWIDCEWSAKEPYVLYWCGVFHENGKRWARDEYALVEIVDGQRQPLSIFEKVAPHEYVTYDGVEILLKHERALRPRRLMER